MAALNLLHDLRPLLETPEPAHLGPKTREGSLPLIEIESRLGPIFKSHPLVPGVQQLLRAMVYLWHDHLDESHHISQEIENRDGSLIHGIMHRREPDYSNAKYWFRRVGPHPSFLALALKTAELLEKHAEGDLHSRLIPNKMWDPYAFVDAVEDTASGKFPSQVMLLEQIQKLEFECLLENLVNRA